MNSSFRQTLCQNHSAEPQTTGQQGQSRQIQVVHRWQSMLEQPCFQRPKLKMKLQYHGVLYCLFKSDVRSSTQKVDPSPTFDCRPRRPPLSLTICLTSAKPNPVPLPPINESAHTNQHSSARLRQTLQTPLLCLVKRSFNPKCQPRNQKCSNDGTYRTIYSGPCPSA